VIAIGVGIIWAGYTLAVWGYCLIRSYDVSFVDLFKTTWPAGTTGAAAAAGTAAGAATGATA
jgi:hypothetical protein